MAEEKWNSYICNVNDKLASVFLDIALATSAPLQEKPWLLWVWVYMKEPREDGLSSQGEFEMLCKLEDALKSELSALKVTLAGRITTQGRREFYFYGPSEGSFRSTVQSALNQFRGYEFDVGSRLDPRWSQYFQVLFPSDIDFERMKNRDVLDVLQKHGDDHSAVRNVRHWLYFATAQQREYFVSSAKAFGYKVERTSEISDRGNEFGVELSKEQNVIPTSIDGTTIELLRLAKQFGGEYDGWETQVTT